jgi:hypothetical protein
VSELVADVADEHRLGETHDGAQRLGFERAGP